MTQWLLFTRFYEPCIIFARRKVGSVIARCCLRRRKSISSSIVATECVSMYTEYIISGCDDDALQNVGPGQGWPVQKKCKVLG